MIGINVDEDPAEVMKTLELSTDVPVFICRYKLIIGPRLKRIFEPYIQSEERNEKTPKSSYGSKISAKNSPLNKSAKRTNLHDTLVKQGGKKKTLKVVLERCKLDSHMNDSKGEVDKLSECSSGSWTIKRKSDTEADTSKDHSEIEKNESICLNSSIDYTDREESVRGRSRSCSPIIPLTGLCFSLFIYRKHRQ